MSCTVCNHWTSEVIPAWNRCEHEFVGWVTDEAGSSSTCIICGYHHWEAASKNTGWVWIVVGVVAVGAVVAVTVVIVKKKR